MEQLNAAVAARDPLVAVSYLRALVLAQHREDEARHRQMQQALEEWRRQRQQQHAAFMRVLDRLTPMLSGGGAGVDAAGVAAAAAAVASAVGAPASSRAVGGDVRVLPSISEDIDGGMLSDTSASIRTVAHP